MKNIGKLNGDRTSSFHTEKNSSECGVAILMPRTFKGQAVQQFRDCDGRLLLVSVPIGDLRMSLFVIYAPTQSHTREQASFFELLRTQLCGLAPKEVNYVIIGGDCNVHLGQLDTDSKRFRVSGPANDLSASLRECRLVDAWRHRHPKRVQFSWRQTTPLQQSRLDYFFVSKYLISSHTLSRIEISPGILSDHSIINLELCLYSSERGPGLWRFNNQLLQDQDFVRDAKEEIRKALVGEGVYVDVVQEGLLLEMICSHIRVLSIKGGKML